MPKTPSSISKPSLLNVINHRLSKYQKDRESITRTMLVCKTNAQATMSVVTSAIQGIAGTLEGRLTGMILLNNATIFAYVECSSRDSIAFVSQFASLKGGSHFGILISSDDVPTRVLDDLYFKDISSDGKPSTSSSIEVDDITATYRINSSH